MTDGTLYFSPAPYARSSLVNNNNKKTVVEISDLLVQD
jgi:hypothetical protein